MCLVRVCTTIEEAVAEIQHFHSNYVNFEVRENRATITIRTPPTDAQLAVLASVVPQFAANEGYVLDDSRTISFNFEGRNYVNLRLLIDQINSWAH
jgi:hypothetical protein